MPAIYLDDATYKRFAELKDEIVSTDAIACKGIDNENSVSYFWSDDMVMNFMLEVMSSQLLEEKLEYTYGKNHKVHGIQQESLR